jgi:hypothetical protein
MMLCLLLSANVLARAPGNSSKPACRAAIRGQFWPQAANNDSKVAQKLSQCGALEMCSVTTWRYKWLPVTVNVRQLGKNPQQPTAACAAVMAEFGAPTHEIAAAPTPTIVP